MEGWRRGEGGGSRGEIGEILTLFSLQHSSTTCRGLWQDAPSFFSHSAPNNFTRTIHW